MAAIGIILLPKLIYVSLFGIENEIGYWRTIINSFGPMNLAGAQANFAVLSILKRTTGAYTNSGLVQLTVICIDIFLLLFTWRTLRCRKSKEENIALEFAYFVVFCLLFSPWLHECHLVVLSLVTTICWFYLADNPKEKNFLYFLMGYLLLGSKYSLESFSTFDKGWLSLLTTGKTIGLILFYCLLYRLISKGPSLQKYSL